MATHGSPRSCRTIRRGDIEGETRCSPDSGVGGLMKRSVSLSRWLAIPTVFFVMVLGGLSMSPASAAPGNGDGHAHRATKAHAAGKRDAKGTSSKAEGGNGGGTTTVKHARPNS